MQIFKDNKDRDWTIEINVAVVKRLKAVLDLDLLSVLDGKLLERFISDPVELCNVLYVLCSPQADERQISDEQFGEGLAGDAIDAATNAFLRELVDFFPSRQRQVLQKALEKWQALEAMTQEEINKVLDSDALEQLLKGQLADHDIVALVRERLAERKPTPGESSTSSPAASASIPIR